MKQTQNTKIAQTQNNTQAWKNMQNKRKKLTGRRVYGSSINGL
jgi:hypothetical protein